MSPSTTDRVPRRGVRALRSYGVSGESSRIRRLPRVAHFGQVDFGRYWQFFLAKCKGFVWVDQDRD